MLDGRGNFSIASAGPAQVAYVCVQGFELCLIVCISLV